MQVIQYNGEHSVTFGDKNTWDDWHLIPSSRPMFAPPEVRSTTQTIPGMQGVLDLSEVLTGYPLYDNRSGTMEFIVAPGYKSWYETYSDIMNYLHGKKMEAYLSDDPYFKYEGRFAVNQWASEEKNSTITIEYSCYPFKMEPFSSDEDWLWDPFDFRYGIIRNFKSLTVDGTLDVKVPGTYDYQSPEFTVTTSAGGGMDVKFNGSTYHLDEGTSANPNILIKDADTTLTFVGNGTVSIKMRGGRL